VQSCLVVSALVLGACGPAQEQDEAPVLTQGEQSVLYPPPTPASGNIVDSTAFLGPVLLGSSVQTRFTTNPQYLSFNFKVLAGAQVKLEVTHLGSSMYLDTGLFVYGPKNASGSYGTTPVAQDDDGGYGQLSKVPTVTLAAGGEYLAVVSSGAGSGKQFRLQLDCLNGACAPQVDPSQYATCDLYVATRIEECVQGKAEEIDPVLGRRMTISEAYAACTDAAHAHDNYTYVCGGSSEAPQIPAWCAGGEAPYTQQMWPVCLDFYKHYYGLYSLSLTQQPLTSKLQTDMNAGNTQCDAMDNWCDGSLKVFSFPWTSTAQPRLDNAVDAVFATSQDYSYYPFSLKGYVPFSEMSQRLWVFSALDPDLLTELGNGTEQVQVAYYYAEYYVAAGAKDWNHLFIVLFPQSHRIAVFNLVNHEI
jgi:hypothetical protein